MKTSILFCSFLTFSLIGTSQNQLYIPDTLSGTEYTLNLQNGTTDFYPGITTQTMGVNGNLLGPTLLLNNGDSINLHVNNQLTDSTTIHWHGMHISAENDGGPHTVIAPSTTWNPGFKVRDKAAMYWYHPHLHKKTNLHVSKGIAGLIIVRDNEESALNLPRTYGVDDIPLVIQTKAFDALNEITIGTAMDTSLMINGTVNPTTDLPAQFVRFRLLNGASQRVFNFGLTNDEVFYQITSDGGLLNTPVPLTRLMLSPGERAEILVDLSTKQGQTLYLMNYGSELASGIYGASQPGMSASQVIPDYTSNPLNGSDTTVLEINVIAPTVSAVTSIPSSLVSVAPFDSTDANVTRNFVLSASQMGSDALNHPFRIDGGLFDMDVINHTIPLNNIEIWEIYNGSPIGHPFHVHDVQFYILDRDGVAPSPNEAGRKDVVFIPAMKTVRFIAQFDDFANDSVPYMYHCHMLTHEDDGMMGQFIVVNNVGINEINSTQNFELFPNPVMDQITLRFPEKEIISSMEIFDLNGKLISKLSHSSGNISFLAPGSYILKATGINSVYSSLFVKQ